MLKNTIKKLGIVYTATGWITLSLSIFVYLLVRILDYLLFLLTQEKVTFFLKSASLFDNYWIAKYFYYNDLIIGCSLMMFITGIAMTSGILIFEVLKIYWWKRRNKKLVISSL